MCSTFRTTCGRLRLRGRPVLHLPVAVDGATYFRVLLDVVGPRRRRRAPGDGEARAGRRGVELDARPRRRRATPIEVPAGRRLPARPRASGDARGVRGGSGITPVFSILKTALATTDRRFHLLYANRDRDSVIFGDDIDALAAASRRPARGRQPVRRRWTGSSPTPTRSHLVEAVARRRLLHLRSGTVHGHRRADAARRRGRRAARIHIERFTPADPIDDEVDGRGRLRPSPRE